MDDLKVYAPNATELSKTLAVVERVSTNLGMSLNHAKCAQAHMVNGKVPKSRRPTDPNSTEGAIKTLVPGETYRYLGTSQLFDQDILPDREAHGPHPLSGKVV